jgi:hypothetical protein
VCIAPAVVLVGLSSAHAADTTLTLACQPAAQIRGGLAVFTKRKTVLGGLLTIIAGGGFVHCRAQASDIRGCILPSSVARSYLDNLSERLILPDYLIARSGNVDFDYALAQTLSRLTDIFQVLPGFAFFNVGNSRQAYATDERLMANPDGTVLFGRNLLFELLAGLDHPDAAVAAVCAHEFGHIVQYKNRLVLDRNQSTAKRTELHADFLAGYYAGVRKLEKQDFPAAVFAATQEKAGDYAFANRQHHGRPEERAAAIVRGFEVAYRERHELSEAIQIGVNYVSAI